MDANILIIKVIYIKSTITKASFFVIYPIISHFL